MSVLMVIQNHHNLIDIFQFVYILSLKRLLRNVAIILSPFKYKSRDRHKYLHPFPLSITQPPKWFQIK